LAADLWTDAGFNSLFDVHLKQIQLTRTAWPVKATLLGRPPPAYEVSKFVFQEASRVPRPFVIRNTFLEVDDACSVCSDDNIGRPRSRALARSFSWPLNHARARNQSTSVDFVHKSFGSAADLGLEDVGSSVPSSPTRGLDDAFKIRAPSRTPEYMASAPTWNRARSSSSAVSYVVPSDTLEHQSDMALEVVPLSVPIRFNTVSRSLEPAVDATTTDFSPRSHSASVELCADSLLEIRDDTDTELHDALMSMPVRCITPDPCPSLFQAMPPPAAEPLPPGPLHFAVAAQRPQALLPSLGSASHSLGTCKPCAFVSRGCRAGADCVFCHLCPPSDRKRGRWNLKRRKDHGELFHEAVVLQHSMAAARRFSNSLSCP